MYREGIKLIPKRMINIFFVLKIDSHSCFNKVVHFLLLIFSRQDDGFPIYGADPVRAFDQERIERVLLQTGFELLLCIEEY